MITPYFIDITFLRIYISSTLNEHGTLCMQQQNTLKFYAIGTFSLDF